jgi:MoxR-like ATPase
MQAGVREIYVDSAISDYIVRLVNATRNHPDVYLGASPRGSLALYRSGQAFAALSGRDFVIPDDIKLLAEPALAHRLIVRTAATIRDVDPAAIVREILDSVPVEGRSLPPDGVAPLPPGMPLAAPGEIGPIPMQGGPRQTR